MTNTTESPSPVSHSTDLLDEVRESAKSGQHAAAEALRKFRQIVDEAIPEAVEPLRAKIIDAAVDLADTLTTTQYNFHRQLIRSADRALHKSDGHGEHEK
jgi:hypothetical protein